MVPHTRVMLQIKIKYKKQIIIVEILMIVQWRENREEQRERGISIKVKTKV